MPIEELDLWIVTKHNGSVFEGVDAGCVGLTLWDEVDLEIRISGNDIGLDAEGMKRLALLILDDLDDMIAHAQRAKRAQEKTCD